MATKYVKPEFIILQARVSTIYKLLELIQQLAEQDKQISICKDGPEWVVSYNEGPSQG